MSMGSGPSPPTMPLANSLREVVETRAFFAGAKALAEATRAAVTKRDLTMVVVEVEN